MKRILFMCLAAMALGFSLTVKAADRVTLTFTRTGTSATDFKVVVAGVEGATAKVTSSSHALMGLSDNTIVCPNVNGNTSPTIKLEFSITGLPADFTFNTVGLNIHALNASGGYQQTNDGKNRLFNVAVGINDSGFANYNNIDIAAGITGANKHWEQAGNADVSATDPLTLSVTITKGTENVGCFFGLQAIVLGLNGAPYEPEPEVQPDGPDHSQEKVYTIRWQNNSSSYITEQADGSLAVGDYGINNKVFWKFIPTDKDNCFYIQNTATGHYIGSCNMTQSSASRVKISEEPQEYYVGGPVSTTGANNGCFWLSSTDCNGYDTANASTGRGLNKDGASSYVITYYTGTTNVGSYWSIAETGDLYEVQPFTPSAQIGQATAAYHITNPEGLAYDATGEWVAFDPLSQTQQWYFVGASNAEGGYQIVCLADHKAIANGEQYEVIATEGFAPYHFAKNGEQLSLGNVSDFIFVAARTAFALNNQIYKMPCGSTGDIYIQQATIGDDFRYPMPTYAGNGISNANATAPSNKYVFLTRDAATVMPGKETQLALKLNKAPGNYKAFLYLDWDRDGYFETCQDLNATAQEIATVFTVPADATTGKTRARIRITDNGLAGADDDTHGEVLDLMLNIVNESAELIAPTVKVNDPIRGDAVWADGTAKATTKGNSLFLYWSEKHRIVSVDHTYEVAASALPRTLTAFFSPRTEFTDGIDNAVLSKTDATAQILCNGKEISVQTTSAVKSILLFAPNGAQVAGTRNATLSVAGMAPGLYIVKAITANGVASAKINL